MTIFAWPLLLIPYSGMFLAGYFGLWEILVEYLFITAILSGIYGFLAEIVLTHRASPNGKGLVNKIVKKIVLGKSDSMEELIKGRRITLVIFSIIFSGVFLGWVLTLSWFFDKDWDFVICREIFETLLDVWIFTPFLLALYFLFHKLQQKIDKLTAEEEAEVEENPIPWIPDYDSRTETDEEEQGPLAWVPPGAFRGQAPNFEVSVKRMGYFFKGTFLLLIGISFYALGALGNIDYMIWFSKFFHGVFPCLK